MEPMTTKEPVNLVVTDVKLVPPNTTVSNVTTSELNQKPVHVHLDIMKKTTKPNVMLVHSDVKPVKTNLKTVLNVLIPEWDYQIVLNAQMTNLMTLSTKTVKNVNLIINTVSNVTKTNVKSVKLTELPQDVNVNQVTPMLKVSVLNVLINV